MVVVLLHTEMLSKMMKVQPKNDNRLKKNTDESEIYKKTFPTDTVQRNEKKRMKPNLKSTHSASAAHGTSKTNWEKFQELIKDSVTAENKTKSKPLHTQTFPRHKRNYNNIQSTAAATNLTTYSSTVIETNENSSMEKKRNLLTRQVAMDCEMVGIGDGSESMLARVSIVNRYGDCIYDKYVKPREKVLDYRTAVSGIRPHHLHNGEEFEKVQQKVAEILNGRILVGHALKHDTDVLYLSHPRRHIRDTSRYKQFRKVSKGNTPSLKKLASELLGITIQDGEHNSVEDARTAMQLYILYKNQWEMDIRTKR